MHTCANTYMHVFFLWLPVCHKPMRCSDSKTVSKIGKKSWEVGKVWKYSLVLNQNISPSKILL